MSTERILQRWARKLGTVPRGLTDVGQRTLDYLSVMGIRSEVRIDVIIPVAPKDLEVVPYCIDGVRRNIRHPIQEIFVVSPLSQEVQDLCVSKSCTFVDERQLLDIEPPGIGLVVEGVDRSAWIMQQLLKWSAESLTTTSHFLVVDADTVFVRPQVFERNGRIIFNYGDWNPLPYFEMYRRLLGEPVLLPVSFVTHQMLYDRELLLELKARLEQIHQCNWKVAILRNLDRSELSAFSEYDTYGHFVLLHHSECMAIEYWCNLALRRKRNLAGVAWLSLKYGGKYKSLSFHSYGA